MAQWFFVSDLHLGHSNIIKYCKRPFVSTDEESFLRMAESGNILYFDVKISQESTERMNARIIDSINATVSSGDNLVILGDFCFIDKYNKFGKPDAGKSAKQYRDRINCKNIYLIYGNHDDRRILSPLFSACFDQHMWNINGQKVFTSHYPCRTWDSAHHGAYMLYGHTHAALTPEDNGQLLPYDKMVFTDGFNKVLKKYNIDQTDAIVEDLLKVAASTKGINLTLDVGVDNQRKNMPFGTPWSMDEIHAYMAKKKSRWLERKQSF